MYAVGVRTGDAAAAFGAGVYLFQGHNGGGWGGGGKGAQSNWEHYGQEWGRWFVPLPYGVVSLKSPASVCNYAGRLYITGAYSYNTVLDEQHRMWRQGIMPAAEIPDVTGSGVANGNYAYYSWFDEYTNERSPLSKGLEIGDTAPRTWSNLPTRPPDDIYAAADDVTSTTGNDFTYPVGGTGNRLYQLRPGDKMSVDGGAWSQCAFFNPLMFDRAMGANVAPASCVVVPVTRATHLELWLSLDGDLPRLAMRVAVGTTTVVESTTVDQLGEAYITAFQRFPRCRFNTIYHDRQVMAGDAENPDTVYLSALFFPERYEGLLFRTRDGQSVTGLLATRDYCLVFTRNTTYILQGYTDSDYSMTVVDQSLGSVGHNCNIVIHGNPYVWTEKGPFMFNGQWHPLSPENRWNPVSDQNSILQDARLEAGQRMIATDDPRFNTYIVSAAHVAARDIGAPFSLPKIDQLHRYYAVVDYTLVQPESGGNMMPSRVSFDSSFYGADYANGGGSVSADGDPGATNSLEFMKFLRNRWGAGALYHIGGRWNSFQDAAFRPFSFAIIPMFNGDTTNMLSNPYSGDEVEVTGPYYIRMPSRILTGFYYFDSPDAYCMESKSFKRLWFHMRRLKTEFDYIRAFATPDSGYWNRYFNAYDNFVFPTVAPVGDDPVVMPFPDGSMFLENHFQHVATDTYDVARPEAGIGDIILPNMPEFLSGRGLWLDIYGYGLQFHGFGAQFVQGADSQIFAPDLIEV